MLKTISLLSLVLTISSASLQARYQWSREGGNNDIGFGVSTFLGDSFDWRYDQGGATRYDYNANLWATARWRQYSWLVVELGTSVRTDFLAQTVRLSGRATAAGFTIFNIRGTVNPGTHTAQIAAPGGIPRLLPYPDVQLMVGPVPVVVRFNVSARVHGVLTGSVRPTGGNASIRPRAELAAIASAGAGVPWASAGAECKLSLLNASVVGGVHIDRARGRTFNVDLEFGGLNGHFALYAEAGNWKYTYPIVTWEGRTRTVNLANQFVGWLQ